MDRMARRVWLIGVAAVVVIALASLPNSSDETVAGPTTQPTTQPTTTVAEPAPTPQTFAPTTTSSDEVVTVPPSSGRPARDNPVPTTDTSTTTTVLQSTAPINAAAFDAAIAAATVDLGDLSAGVAVIRDGTVVHTAAFGMENPTEGRVATVNTRFRLASVSKIFTSVAIMQLVDGGAIKLDGPFVEQLGVSGPFADPRIATVTVRQLLSHMSGFPISRNIFFGHGLETWRQAAKAALGQVLLFDPGTAFQYSNTNFCLLGLLIEKITGQSFETAITKRVLDPAGARSHAHLAPTFDDELGDAVHASGVGRNYMEVLGPAGGWVATPLDVAKVAAALRGESTDGEVLLETATVDLMRVPVPVPVETPPPVTWWSYGLGLMLYADGSWGHSGTIESTHALVINRPDGLTVALLVSGKFPSNSDDLLTIIDQAVAASNSA
jgi:D-alanyl-D-alanine carboxypeptidase